jgi:CYTH domain-containing protein
MAIEIERKFLVRGDVWRESTGVQIVQGYLSRDRRHSVRIRVSGKRAFLTIKGSAKGFTRSEFEYEIPVDDANQMLPLCVGLLIKKVRHRVEHDGKTWEVDEFLDENRGLVVAELELQSEDEPFARPPWLGEEVTEDPRYLNVNLSENPFGLWNCQANGAAQL